MNFFGKRTIILALIGLLSVNIYVNALADSLVDPEGDVSSQTVVEETTESDVTTEDEISSDTQTESDAQEETTTQDTTDVESNTENTPEEPVIDDDFFVELIAQDIFDDQDILNPVLKIGFLYGSDAVATTNLDNYTGSGHSFGYFDDNYNFTSLFQTDYEAISILKNDNIYLGTDGLYYDTKLSNSQGLVGAYSIELSVVYDNANDALYKSMTVHDDAFPVYIDGVYKVRVDSFSTEANAQSALATIRSETGDANAYVVYPRTDLYTVTSTKSIKVLFQFADNGKDFGVLPNGDITWTKGYRYYGGFEYSRLSGGDITVVNVVTMQDYVKGVVPYEMSGSWEIEALKAQALCARSYAFNCIGKHSKYGFDLCKSTCCQVYNGTGSATTNSDAAVDQTYGEYIDYQGAIATGYFYSSNGGATENSENVWSEAVPYLRAKIDPYERSAEVYNGVWEVTVTNSQIAAILQAKNYNISGVSNMYIKKYTDIGNVYTLTVVDTNGKEYDFSKELARTILNSTTYGVSVNSIRYRINEVMEGDTAPTAGEVYINDEKYSTDNGFYIIGQDGITQSSDINGMYVLTADGTNEIQASESTDNSISHADGEYVISGRGWGHNVGMSQYGAKHMAEAGFTYDQIIEFYFDGTTVKKIG
ncbi:MAG: SpoIID/LytB domain-containing protein [Clostridia bacterium]